MNREARKLLGWPRIAKEAARSVSKRKRTSKAVRSRGASAPAGQRRRVLSRKWLCVAVGLAALALGIWAWPRAPRDPHSTTEPSEESAITFEEDAEGVGFVLSNGTTEDKPMPDSTLGGVALFDCDSDGLLDIYFTNGARFPDFKKESPAYYNRLYRNLGERTFEDRTSEASVAGRGYSMGVAAADYDNDGWTDLYVSGVDRNTLFRNLGDCRFEDVTERAGVDLQRADGKPWSVAAAWLDYNADGHLDLFVVNYVDWSWAKNRVCGDPGRRLSCSPAHYAGLPNALFRNRGDGTFEDASRATGVAEHVGKGMSAAIADYDGDGFQDVFVTNDSVRNFLFRNVNGKRFEEVAVEAGVAFTGDGIPVSSMGLDFRDLNGDGLPDVIYTALSNETFPLFVNQGNGSFADATYASKLGLEAYTKSGWSVGTFDFDNDGDKDLFTANSHVSENVELYRSVAYRMPNSVFKAMEDGTYRDVASGAGPALRRAAAHRGAAFGDLDNDGRVDVVVSAIGSEASVLFNESRGGNWLMLDLKGAASNRTAIGAVVKLVEGSGRVQYNHVSTAVGYASASDRRVHFGLGPSRTVRAIEVRWPSGKVQVLENVEAGVILKITEPL